MTQKYILVSGATGRQGRALIEALRPSTDAETEFHVLALTRNPASAAAKSLASEPHVMIVQGNLDSPASVQDIFENSNPKLWGVFCMLAFPGLGANADKEEAQGKLLADLSLKFGISCFIFSSVERGNDKNDDTLELDRLAKARIERHIRELGGKGLPWTILRPGFFMENYDGAIGSLTAAVLQVGLKPDTTIQLIGVEDIGRVGASIFKNPSPYSSRILTVVSERLTMTEQLTRYQKATGKSMTSVPSFIARTLVAMNKHTQGLIKHIEQIQAERVKGEYLQEEIQTEATRSAYPDLMTFEEWASKRKLSTGKRTKNWNRLTLSKLLRGQL